MGAFKLDDSLIAAAAHAAGARDRDFVGSPFAAEVARVEREHGAASRSAFLRDVLRALVERNRPAIAEQVVSEPVKVLIGREYERIEKDFETGGEDHYTLSRHDMRCDFRIVCFSRLPTGAGHIEVGGLPRHLLWSGGVSQAWRTALLLGESGGRAPFYVAHFTHRISRATFLRVLNADAMATSYQNVADCMRMNPHIRGSIATSWWYDPKLSIVAPHLSFLRESAVAHGAVLLRSGITDGAKKLALSRSKTRQNLFESGAYVPTSYSVVWTRKALALFAESVAARRSPEIVQTESRAPII